MKKVFTLLLMSIITSIGVWAQKEATASANFIVSDGGKTLTVSGKGDLTTLEINTYETKFTATAVGAVFVKSGESYASVNAGDAFYDNTSYYKLEVGDKTAIVNTAENQFLSNTTYVTSYSKDKYLKSDYVGKVFTSATNPSNASSGWIADGTLVAATDVIDTNTKYYYIIDADNGKYNVKVNGTVTKANAISDMSNYCSEVTMFTAALTIYVSTDGGSSFTQIAEGSSAIYNESATYYTAGSTTYSEYPAKNLTESFTESNYIEKSITETKSFCNTLKDMVTSGSYERVIFVNEDAPASLKIDGNIISAVLQSNTIIKEVDFGAATFDGLVGDEGSKYYFAYCENLSTITIPLTKKTTVTKEPDFSAENIFQEGTEEKMVVPADILSGYQYKSSFTTLVIPDGYEAIADGAFMYMGYLEKVVLPNTLEVIGKNAFNACKVTEIEFPSTLRIIKDAAFFNVKIEDLKFNAGLNYIGNSAFGQDAEMKLNTIQIPASVKYIGPHAFCNRKYQDVYFLGENAPIMPMGKCVVYASWGESSAFSEDILMGNSGFEPIVGKDGDIADNPHYGYANRENYKSSGNYFSILHFPTGLTDEQRAKYTDITRVYKTNRDKNGDFHYGQSSNDPETYDEVGKESETLSFNNKYTAFKTVPYGYEDTYLGKQNIWPSQAQWTRSYVVNSLGYNWNGVTKYRPTLSKKDMQVLAYAGYVIKEEGGQYTEDYLQMIAHMGTRQFVLTNADTKKDTDTEEEPVYPISVKGSNWWTICVPFNMTKAQVDEVFGSGTHVCRFSSVTRTDDGKGNKSITLRFQNDVYATKWTRDEKTLAYTKNEGVTPDNEDIVIYSHEAYMIYPTKSSEDANGMYNIKDYKLETGSPLPTIIKANANETENADQTEYRFVGNYVTEVSTGTATNADAGVATAAYETVTIPQYSYIYAKKKNDAAYKFWFFTGTQMAWSPNKCVVQATARDGGAQDYSNFFGGNANNSKVSQVSLFGEDGTVTEIENVTIIAGEGENAQIVYNLNGQVVSSNGNTDRLAKGVYIKGGKKFMVK